MQTLELFLNQITIDPALQPRVNGLDDDYVKALQEVIEFCPPIRAVKKDGAKNDVYILIDGFHRFAAMQNISLAKTIVEIIDVKNGDDLFALAYIFNNAHGLPLTLNDRRAYAGKLLKAHPDWADREIGRRCGLMQPTVAKVRQELEQKASIPVVTERIGRDGQKYAVPPKKQADKAQSIKVVHQNITPAGRASQRQITSYLMKLADLLEEQDELPDFKTLHDAAQACHDVLGDKLASALADRLGWTSYDILQIAKLLGYRKEKRS